MGRGPAEARLEAIARRKSEDICRIRCTRYPSTKDSPVFRRQDEISPGPKNDIPHDHLIARQAGDWIVIAGKHETAEIAPITAIFADSGVEFNCLRPG